MSVQEVSIANNQRKRLLKAISDEQVLFRDENGDLVLNVAAYRAFSDELEQPPVEAIVADELNWDAEFIVFS